MAAILNSAEVMPCVNGASLKKEENLANPKRITLTVLARFRRA